MPDEDQELRDKLRYWRETGGLNVSPQATPNRRPGKGGKPREPNNAWERGVATDSRGMPYLDSNLSPIGVKELSHSRHKYREFQKTSVSTKD